VCWVCVGVRVRVRVDVDVGVGVPMLVHVFAWLANVLCIQPAVYMLVCARVASVTRACLAVRRRTVGEALVYEGYTHNPHTPRALSTDLMCRRCSFFRRTRGMYVSSEDRGQMAAMMYNWPHRCDVMCARCDASERAVVVGV
jgi:hypothetical protein